MPPVRGPIGVKPKKPKVPKNTSILPRLTLHPTTGPAARSVGDTKSAADLGRARHYQQRIQHEVHDTKGASTLHPTGYARKQHKELVNLARRIIQVHKHSESHPGIDTKSNLDLLTAEAFKLTPQFEHDFTQSALAHAEYQKEKDSEAQGKKAGGGFLGIPGFIHGEGPIIAATNKAADIASSVGRVGVRGLEAAGTLGASEIARNIPALSGVQKIPEKIIGNAAKELIDIPANAIPAAYYLAEPAAHGRFQESGRRLIQPYQQLYHHPGKTFVEHPLSTTLMVAGPLKGAGRLAGRVEREVSGDYAPISRKYPGTAMRELVTPEKGAIGYRLQKAREPKLAAKQLAAAEVNRYSHPIKFRKQTKETLREAKRLGIKPRMSDSALRYRVNQHFYRTTHMSMYAAQEFYKKALKEGIAPKLAAEEADNVRLATRLIYQDKTYMDAALREKGGTGSIRTFDDTAEAESFIQTWKQAMRNQGRTDVPELTPVTLHEPMWEGTGVPPTRTIIVVPSVVKEQWNLHENALGVGATNATKIGMMVGGGFRRTVLPFSVKWMHANIVEGGLIRLPISGGALPTSIKAGIDFEKHLKNPGENLINPEFYQTYRTLVAGGGHGQMQRDLLMEVSDRTLAERFARTDGTTPDIAQGLTDIGQNKFVKLGAKGLDKWTDFVFHDVNGNLERGIHVGMAGKYLRDHPLMTNKMKDLATKAAQHAEAGHISESEFMNYIIPMGKELRRMFGRYGAFSPTLRRWIGTWTPFLAWSLNAAQFVLHYLPKEHPLFTALLADAHVASAGWRQQHGLAESEAGAVPFWLMGSVPVGNSKLRASQWTPFGFWGDPTMTLTGQFNPLGESVLANLQGKDWKGQDLPDTSIPGKLKEAGFSLAAGTLGPAGPVIGALHQHRSLGQVENPLKPVPPKKDSSGQGTDLFKEKKKSKGVDLFKEKSSSKGVDLFK